jgi:hypothetical protein
MIIFMAANKEEQTMTTINVDYERQVFEEIQRFPVTELPKVLKLLAVLREDILDVATDNVADAQRFWNSFGSWQDTRSAEELVTEVYAACYTPDREIGL